MDSSDDPGRGPASLAKKKPLTAGMGTDPDAELIQGLTIKDYLIGEAIEEEGREVTVEELMAFFQLKQ